jgi:hypothetical protein
MNKKYKRGFSDKSSSQTSENSSAYERLNSSRMVAANMLPNFMRPNGPPKSMSIYQAPDRSRSPIYNSRDKDRPISPDMEQFTYFFHSVFDPNKDPSEIMLKVRQRDLYREDLRTFSVGESLTRSVIDGCLSIIKQLNHDFLIKDEANDKVIISSTEFSQGIFCTTKTSIVHAPTYIMKYE